MQAPFDSDIPKRWPLAVAPENRDRTTAKDAKLVNAYAEKTNNGYQVYKRPGTAFYSTSPVGGIGSGVYYSTDTGGTTLIVGIGTSIYYDGAYVGSVTSPGYIRSISFNRFPGSNGAFLVNSFENGNVYYITHAGVWGSATINGGSSIMVPGSAYLDNTMYVMDANGNIFGSNLGDITTWNASNVIKAQIEPDGGVCLAKHLVYVVALKQYTTEFFYDAGNPTNSPLSPVQGTKLNFGCADSGTVQEIDGNLFFVSATKGSAGVQVVMIKDLKATVISTKAIDRLLSAVIAPSNIYQTHHSYQYKNDGHTFYVVYVTSAKLILAYDIDEGLWAQWSGLDILCSSGPYYQRLTLGDFVTFSPTQYEDNTANSSTQPISVDIYTENFDAGLDRNKTLNMMRFLGDKTTGSVIKVRHNDNDYDAKKWSSFRYVDMSKERPFIANEGTFRRRAYHLNHTCNTQMRIEALDIQMDLGTL